MIKPSLLQNSTLPVRFGQVTLVKPDPNDEKHIQIRLTDEDCQSSAAQLLASEVQPDGSKTIDFFLHHGNHKSWYGSYSSIQLWGETAQKLTSQRLYNNSPQVLNALLALTKKAKDTSPSELWYELRTGLQSYLDYCLYEQKGQALRARKTLQEAFESYTRTAENLDGLQDVESLYGQGKF